MNLPSVREPDVSDAERTALHLWVVMSRAHAAVAELADAHVTAQGLTLAEFGILEALYHKGPMLLGEVQRRILVSSGGVTYLVDRLVNKGYVERRSCPDDRRARYAALTPDGEALIAAIFPGHAEQVGLALGALTADEQRTAADLLKRLGLAAAELSR